MSSHYIIFTFNIFFYIILDLIQQNAHHIFKSPYCGSKHLYRQIFILIEQYQYLTADTLNNLYHPRLYSLLFKASNVAAIVTKE